MTASEAKIISDSIKKLNTLKEKLSIQPSEVVNSIWRSIIDAILMGQTICSSYIMSSGVKVALTTAGFYVDEEIEDDIKYYTISWEENASKSRSKKRKSRIK